MRIACPYCGDRPHAEFSYRGDAAPIRPASSPDRTEHDRTLFLDYVYMRTNSAGWHTEHWQHTGGCRAWLVVERHTSTHAIARVGVARDQASRGTAPQ